MKSRTLGKGREDWTNVISGVGATTGDCLLFQNAPDVSKHWPLIKPKASLSQVQRIPITWTCCSITLQLSCKSITKRQCVCDPVINFSPDLLIDQLSTVEIGFHRRFSWQTRHYLCLWSRMAVLQASYYSRPCPHRHPAEGGLLCSGVYQSCWRYKFSQVVFLFFYGLQQVTLAQVFGV